MSLSATERIDAVNIGLMLLSSAIAIVLPLELFLFSYAILGPLHYLTEISWLHDRHYFAKGRYDAVMLLTIGLLATVGYYSLMGYVGLDVPQTFMIHIGYIGLLSGAVFALVKNTFLRIAGIILIIVSAQISEHFALFFGAFLPTLVHVYVFTGLFMLYGALKSGSKLGLVSVACLILCPILLVTVLPDFQPGGFSDYMKERYVGDRGTGFISLHMVTLHEWFGLSPAEGTNPAQFWMDQTFNTKTGILILRCIAFAYTYHYLNWFSKTKIIQWHKVPKARFAAVIALWAFSIALFLFDYVFGFMWLFFLSYLHVLLEFPLNYTSIIGIGRSLQQRIFRPAPVQP